MKRLKGSRGRCRAAWRTTALCFAFGAIVALYSCHDQGPPPPPPPPPPGASVSGPLPPPTPVARSVQASLAGTTATEVAYVSLAPQTAPGGLLALIVNNRTGDTLSVPVGAGGFDPVAVPAVAGDTVDITVLLRGGGSRVFVQAVPLKHSPAVVRTNPSSGKRDVPLNTTIGIVFSQPIDPTTVTASTVQLRRGSTPVAGTLQFLNSEHVTLLFMPAAQLAPSTVYTIDVTQGVLDLEGDALVSAFTAEFTTAATPPGYEEYFVDAYLESSVHQVDDTVSVDQTVRVMDGAGTGIERALLRFRASVGQVESDTTRAGLDGLATVHWKFAGIVGVLPPQATAELDACASNSTTRCDMYWPEVVIGFNPL